MYFCPGTVCWLMNAWVLLLQDIKGILNHNTSKCWDNSMRAIRPPEVLMHTQGGRVPRPADWRGREPGGHVTVFPPVSSKQQVHTATLFPAHQFRTWAILHDMFCFFFQFAGLILFKVLSMKWDFINIIKRYVKMNNTKVLKRGFTLALSGYFLNHTNNQWRL